MLLRPLNRITKRRQTVTHLVVQTENGELFLDHYNAKESTVCLASPGGAGRYYPTSHLSEEDQGRIEDIRRQVVGLFEVAARIINAAPTHEEELPWEQRAG